MRHVIVIETPDRDETNLAADIMQEFQKTLINLTEIIAEHFEGTCFVQSRFYVESAVEAVQEMYN